MAAPRAALPTATRRYGVASLAVGFLLIVVAQALTPLGAPPLYDGVVPVEPYRYLTPPPGAPGDPSNVTITAPIGQAGSPQITAATSESPPQAQLIALEGSFDVRTATGPLAISISPVAPAATPARGRIAGNVYRVTVTDGSGVDLETVEGKTLTVVLRAPEGVEDGTVARLVDGAWVELDSFRAQPPALAAYAATVSGLGDFAVIATGIMATPRPLASSAGPASGGQSSGLLGVVGVLAGILLLAGLGWWTVRRRHRR